MLLELEVSEFAIIERLRVRLSSGFSVLTGETGAGKSLLVDAVGQLLGERADTGMIRSGADTALIEGVFDPDARSAALKAVLHDYGVEPGPELILRREIHSTGRSTARINGRAVPVRALAEVGAALVDIHGQSENVSIKREAEHVELLDRYAGLSVERNQLAQMATAVRNVSAELGRLHQDEAELARRAALLAFQVEEIEAARLSPGEEDELVAERTRLANAERLAVLADAAYKALSGDDDGPVSALDRVGAASDALDRLAEIDVAMAERRQRVGEAQSTLADISSDLLAYRDSLEFDPSRLDEIEDRLLALADLKRKYGPNVPAVLAYAASASDELATLSSAEERIATLAAEHDGLLQQIGDLAGTVSTRRRKAGEALSAAVEEELETLGMPGSAFEVSLERQHDPGGAPIDGECWSYDSTGVDRVAFLVSTNPGEPTRPLSRVASGGETSRLMLALKGILTAADKTPTLVFDEIDAGIGGRIGAVVGRKLWALSERHQVLCVTHLPQVAAYADSHLRVWKDEVGERTAAQLEPVDGQDRVAELTSMLGASTDATRESAAELLRQSKAWKLEPSHGHSDRV